MHRTHAHHPCVQEGLIYLYVYPHTKEVSLMGAAASCWDIVLTVIFLAIGLYMTR